MKRKLRLRVYSYNFFFYIQLLARKTYLNGLELSLKRDGAHLKEHKPFLVQNRANLQILGTNPIVLPKRKVVRI